SGSGKASVLKAFEDMGYYSVDNMPIELVPRFVDMTLHSSEIERTALVVDIREGHGLERLPKILDEVRSKLKVRVIFLETSDEADLVFDVRFLPHPHFIPELRPFTGTHPKVAKYVMSFPQTREFIKRIADLLVYLLPHYIREGKSYLTVGFGCTGGQHRSVLIAREMQKALADAGYQVKVSHRDATP